MHCETHYCLAFVVSADTSNIRNIAPINAFEGINRFSYETYTGKCEDLLLRRKSWEMVQLYKKKTNMPITHYSDSNNNNIITFRVQDAQSENDNKIIHERAVFPYAK